jgi:hypothetical protein
MGVYSLTSTRYGGKNVYILYVFNAFYSGCCKVAVEKEPPVKEVLFDPISSGSLAVYRHI